MENNTTITEISKAVDRKPSKLQLLKSLIGAMKKLEEMKKANPKEIETLKGIVERLKQEVIGEM